MLTAYRFQNNAIPKGKAPAPFRPAYRLLRPPEPVEEELPLMKAVLRLGVVTSVSQMESSVTSEVDLGAAVAAAMQADDEDLIALLLAAGEL